MEQNCNKTYFFLTQRLSSRQQISEKMVHRSKLEAAVDSQQRLLAKATQRCTAVQSERDRLREEEIVHEHALGMKLEQLEAKKCRGAERSNSYWERAPFLSTDSNSFERYKEELQSEREELQQLEAELCAALVAKQAAELHAHSERQKEEKTQRERQQNLQKLTRLQSTSSSSSKQDVGVRSQLEVRPKDNIDQLRRTQQHLRQELQTHQDMLAELPFESIQGPSVEQMKEMLKEDLVLMKRLQARKRDLEVHSDQERRLVASLQRQVARAADQPSAEVDLTKVAQDPDKTE